jgi:hypothetical protein
MNDQIIGSPRVGLPDWSAIRSEVARRALQAAVDALDMSRKWANLDAAAGWSVAVVDHRPFGGTCALRGCDPNKMLVAGAEAIDWRGGCAAAASPASSVSTGAS